MVEFSFLLPPESQCCFSSQRVLTRSFVKQRAQYFLSFDHLTLPGLSSFWAFSFSDRAGAKAKEKKSKVESLSV